MRSPSITFGSRRTGHRLINRCRPVGPPHGREPPATNVQGPLQRPVLRLGLKQRGVLHKSDRDLHSFPVQAPNVCGFTDSRYCPDTVLFRVDAHRDSVISIQPIMRFNQPRNKKRPENTNKFYWTQVVVVGYGFRCSVLLIPFDGPLNLDGPLLKS